tara:strand:- start:20380 stop:20619 length:240 start_codon:yes stop_codon:yes gene_type:complete
MARFVGVPMVSDMCNCPTCGSSSLSAKHQLVEESAKELDGTYYRAHQCEQGHLYQDKTSALEQQMVWSKLDSLYKRLAL